jgi:hypothetical protein
MRIDNGGDIWHVLVGAVIGAAVNVAVGYIASLATGNEYNWDDALIDAATGMISGALSSMGVPVGVLVGVNAGMSAAESVYDDVKSNISGKSNYGITEIVGNAAINAGISALFSLSGANPSEGRTMNAMYKSANSARRALKTGGLHPTVKEKMIKSVNAYGKKVKKHSLDCLLDSAIESPASWFSSVYTKGVFNYLVKGIQ